MFYVESGWVKISAVSPNGKEVVVGIRGESKFFGTRCLVDRRMGMATALTACSLIRVTTPALTRLLRETHFHTHQSGRLANMTGTTRPRVSFFMNKFKR
jgi:CRP-like cAMP-binding protein